MALKQKLCVQEIEDMKSSQVLQHDLQSKLRISEKTRLELLSALCESEATIKKMKTDSMKLQEELHNHVIRERQIVEDNDRMWSQRLKLLQDNFESDKQSLLMKLEKEQQMNSEKEKLRELLLRSNAEPVRAASESENLALPVKAPLRQNFQSNVVPQKQGDYLASKKPRASTPNTSRKVPSNSLQVAAVASTKNHVLNQPNDNDLDDFVSEGTVAVTDESLSWNQVPSVVSCKIQLTPPVSISFKRNARA